MVGRSVCAPGRRLGISPCAGGAGGAEGVPVGTTCSVPPYRLGRCGSSCLGGAGLGDTQLGVSPYPLTPGLGGGRFCCKLGAQPQSGAAGGALGAAGDWGNTPGDTQVWGLGTAPQPQVVPV